MTREHEKKYGRINTTLSDEEFNERLQDYIENKRLYVNL